MCTIQLNALQHQCFFLTWWQWWLWAQILLEHFAELLFSQHAFLVLGWVLVYVFLVCFFVFNVGQIREKDQL